MQTILTTSTIFLYGISLVMLWSQLKNRQAQTSTAFKACLVASTLGHIATLHFSVFPGGSLHLGFFKASSLIFCVISIISCISIMRRLPIESLLIPLFPLSITSIVVGQWPVGIDEKIISGAELITHIVLSILAYSIITLASLQALALAAQESILHQHRLKSISIFMPPLQTMEKLLFEMIWLGFVLLTLSIASGFMFLENMFAQHLAHKTILSIIAWLIFGILLLGRGIQGWRGITATKWTISGFLALMLAYFGSKFVLEIILQRI